MPRPVHLMLMGGASLVALALSSTAPAWAETTADASAAAADADAAVAPGSNRSDTTVEEVTVTAGAPVMRASATTTGLVQAIEETPRSVTTVDAALLKNVQVRSIHDLTMVTPGAYTAAYFGVAGAVQLRGNVADSYYRGFKGVNNLGYYETPTETVSSVEIVRGPPTPAYGAGKIGGMVNLNPKTNVAADLKFADAPRALVTAAVGSYDEKKVSAEGGVPFEVGGNQAALYAFVLVADGARYYRHFKPSDKEYQLGYSMELGSKWELNIGGRYLDQTGHLAAPGWNRLTQDLIDNGDYLAGSPAVSLARPGAAGLFPADLQPVINQVRQGVNLLAGNRGLPNAYTALDPATVRTVKLSRRNLNTSPLDFNDNAITTGYADLIRSFDNHDVLKLQVFGEKLDNDMYSAAGSATHARGEVYEFRATYNFERDLTDWLSINSVVGASYRHYKVDDFQNYGRRYVIWDRADLSAEPTPDMIINPWHLNTVEPIWDFKYSTTIRTYGAFLYSDIAVFKDLHFIVGGRQDDYDIDSINRGVTSFGGALNTFYNGKTSPFSWSASVNYRTPIGIIPYATYAESKSLETNKGGGVDPALIIGKKYLSPSKLTEFGVKGSMLDGDLFFGLAGYRQERTQRDALSGAISAARSKGVEFELRYVVTPSFDLLATATWQKTTKIGATTILLTPAQLGWTGQSSYAGEYTISTTQIPGLVDRYEDTTLPREVVSLFGVYRFDNGLQLTGGANYVGKTSGIAPGAVNVDPYTLFKVSATYSWDRYTVDLMVDNLTDERYFYLGQDAYSDVAALPGMGRTVHLRLAAKF